jgi:hypothetical protein
VVNRGDAKRQAESFFLLSKMKGMRLLEAVFKTTVLAIMTLKGRTPMAQRQDRGFFR